MPPGTGSNRGSTRGHPASTVTVAARPSSLRSGACGHHVPESAVEVDVVAAGLTRRGVADVGVERMAAVGGLQGAVRPADRAELRRDDGWVAGGGQAEDRR